MRPGREYNQIHSEPPPMVLERQLDPFSGGIRKAILLPSPMISIMGKPQRSLLLDAKDCVMNRSQKVAVTGMFIFGAAAALFGGVARSFIVDDGYSIWFPPAALAIVVTIVFAKLALSCGRWYFVEWCRAGD